MYRRRSCQVEAGLTVGESTDDAGSAPDLFHDPLQRIVGPDLLPVNVREAIVGQGLVDGLLDEVGCFAHLACPQVANDRLGLVVGGLPALLSVNGLEHMAHLTDAGGRDVAKDVAVEVHHAALVARLRQEIRNALDKAPAGVGNDQLHAFEAAIDQDGAETPTSRLCPPWRPPRSPGSRETLPN